MSRDRIAREGRRVCGYTCVLFDVDNTLVDTDPLIQASLRACGCSGTEDLSVDQMRSQSPNSLLRLLGAPNASDAYWRHYTKLAGSGAQLLDSRTPEVLESLVGRGVAVGVVTSSPKRITQAVLRQCGILRFFEDCLVTYGSCSRRKPYADPILFGLALLEHPAFGAVYVGDAERDAYACKDAEVDFALAGWARLCGDEASRLEPEIILEGVADLLPLCGVREES